MIGNNRHSDRTFVSEHICIRLALFAVRPCSLSPSLSPSLFLLPFLPSLSRFRQPSSSRPPVSRFRFSPPSFSFNARASVLLLLSESPSSSLSLSLSLAIPLLSSIESSFLVQPTIRSALSLRASPRSFSLLFILSLSLFHSVSLSPGWSTLFFHPSARLAHRSFSITPHPSPTPRGFSFADVYISRQVGMQGRTSYVATCECVRARVGARNTPIPPTMYLSLWSRVLPWLVPLGSAYIGNIVCTCQV